MAIASSPGWSETGGPWVKPEQAMKKLVWSELRVTGGTKFAGTLPKPPNTTGPFQAVLWHADTGAIEPVSYRIEDGRTTFSLQLAANESVFVVFRQPAATPTMTVASRKETPLATLDGPWELRFGADFGAPEKVTLGNLESWTENADPGVKYYSGTAAYTETIDVPAAWTGNGHRLILDLGDVRDLAEISVNGRSVGIAWHPPYRVDITGAVKPGANTLEIKATNLWVNRLIGDQQPGAKKYTFTVMSTYKADAPLRPSGMLGPVRMIQE
jgi:hypothetical protein